ncbi:MAG: hypothetical protein DMG39_22290 [Acidobacteria bacterium]|nr:MAG: hypothetical protein DMG39_22290 [Acidobacteriota bacterium]
MGKFLVKAFRTFQAQPRSAQRTAFIARGGFPPENPNKVTAMAKNSLWPRMMPRGPRKRAVITR